MKSEVEFYKQELERLEKFVTEATTLSRQDIIRWVGECTSVFVFLNVPHLVVQGFINTFESYVSKDKYPSEISVWLDSNSAQNRIKNFLYTNVAFEIAKANIQKLSEQEGLVKLALINLLRNDTRALNIVAGLESMEKAYQSNDADSLVLHAQSVLELTCNIPQKLSKLDNIDKKLVEVKNNSQMRRLFGTQDWLLNCFINIYKPIRNKMVMHKKTILPYTSPVPMSVAVGYSFLVLIFIDMALASKKLFRIKSK